MNVRFVMENTPQWIGDIRNQMGEHVTIVTENLPEPQRGILVDATDLGNGSVEIEMETDVTAASVFLEWD
jgi:hypothetical protein